MRATWRCWLGGVLPEGRPLSRRGDKVPRKSSGSAPAFYTLSIRARGVRLTLELTPLPLRRQVYNARKRGGDVASAYFQRTENIAGVKDMRHQELVRSRLCDSHYPCAHKDASDRRCPTFSTGSASRRLTMCVSALEYLRRGRTVN